MEMKCPPLKGRALFYNLRMVLDIDKGFYLLEDEYIFKMDPFVFKNPILFSSFTYLFSKTSVLFSKPSPL